MNDTQSEKHRTLDVETLRDAIKGSAAAFRCRRRLQPAGGPGDKVFPPTFAGAVYAVEERRVPGHSEAVTSVLLDSVQSQANRMEQALQDALDSGRLKIPVLTVDFSQWAPTGDVEADKTAGKLINAIGKITSLHLLIRLFQQATTYWGRPSGSFGMSFAPRISS
jgi:CRISPR-associated protein Csb1